MPDRGAAQAETLARLLALTLDEPKTTVEWISPTRQCEWEFIEPLREQVQNFDVVLSIACGVVYRRWLNCWRVSPSCPD